MEAQIEFMFHELNGTYQSRLSSYSSKYADAAQYKDIQDPREAAFVFCAVYEGCEYNPIKVGESRRGVQSDQTVKDGNNWNTVKIMPRKYIMHFPEEIHRWDRLPMVRRQKNWRHSFHPAFLTHLQPQIDIWNVFRSKFGMEVKK